MPIPAQFVTQADLEDAITGEKLRELLGDKGKAEASPRRVKLCIESGTSFVLGHIQRAVKNGSLDVLWDSPQWTDRDAINQYNGLPTEVVYVNTAATVSGRVRAGGVGGWGWEWEADRAT